MQNFRAKDRTAMAGVPDADFDDFVASVAITRLVLGPDMRVQAPPNLVSRDGGLALIDCRGRRLGRGLAADPGPRQPRAALASPG